MSGDYSDYRSRMNDFGPFTKMQHPRTVLPDMYIHKRSRNEAVVPRVVGEGDERRIEWVLEQASILKPGVTDAQRMAEAQRLLGDLKGMPHHIQFRLAEDGHVEVIHQCGPMHEAVRMRLDKAWSELGGGPVRIIGQRGTDYRDMFQADATLGPQPVPLLRRAVRTHSGQLDIDAFALNPAEKKLLAAWGSGGDLAANMLDRLGSQPKTMAEKIARAEELSTLGVFSPFVTDSLRFLGQKYGEDTLADVHLRYNGHAMFSVAPLAWAASRAFPSKSFTLLASSYSGSRESGNLLGFLMRPGDQLLNRGAQDGFQMHSVDSVFRKPINLPIVSSKVKPSEVYIWEKAADLLSKGVPTEAIAKGVHRFIIHNADDLKAAKKHQGFYGVELWSSKIKALEARFIGELYALLGAREVRTQWKGRVGQTEVRVIGAGLLGMSVAEAHVRLGMPKNSILIIDASKEAREQAAAKGFRTAAPEEVEDSPLKTVCFVATGGPCIDNESVRCFGRDSIVFGLNSGGKVIDEDGDGPSLDVKQKHEVGFEWPVDTGRGVATSYRDRKMIVEREDGQRVQIHAVANFMPANLLHEQWTDRFHVTGIAVLAAGLQLASQKDAKVMPFDPGTDDALMALAEKRGLLELRPLDPRYDESPSQLEADLKDGFSPFGGPLLAQAPV